MVKNKNYDAEFCGNLAIHQTNSIQDFGYLLIIDQDQLKIVQGSENIIEITQKPIKEVVSTSLADYLSKEDFKHFATEISKGQRNRLPFQFSFHVGKTAFPLHILAHVKKDYIILEIEKVNKSNERSFTTVFQEVRSFISTLENIEDLKLICEASIKEIRRLTGFDGIRMYQFNEDWNGTVIAEEVEGGLESYLGQTFPASDVPKQARAMYLKNPFRFIPDRQYQNVKLFPVINPITNGFIDLSDCNLRSIAGVHLEYMANMNVMASMSIRVIVNGVLWGLISCHHVKPKYLGVESRSIFEWLSMEISYRISAVIKQAELLETTKMLQHKAAITDLIYTKNDVALALITDENNHLNALFGTSGFAVCINKKLSVCGNVPDTEDIENLILWLEGRNISRVFTTQKLSEIYDEGKNMQKFASGIIVIPIDAEKGEFLICFRPEAVQNIDWGGNPNQAINFEKDGVTYHPRNSFKIWQQTVYGQSTNWTSPEIEMAEELRSFLFEFRSKQLYL